MLPRGVVVTPKFDIEGTGLRVYGGALDTVSLRHLLLYWDKIDFPINQFVGFPNTPDMDFLISENILSRTNIRFAKFPVNIAEGFIRAQFEALRLLNQEEPGQWVLAQQSKKLHAPKDISVETTALELELYKALPVPGESVSLPDILEFKSRHSSELVAFRSYMDEVTHTAINSVDVPRARVAAIDRLQRAVADLHALSQETWRDRFLSSLKVEINLPNIAIASLAGTSAASTFGFSPTVGAALGAVLGAVKFDLGVTRRPSGLPTNLPHLAFLYRIESELR